MSQHLTEQELIEFQFDLIDGEKASAAAEHLAGCSRCAEAAAKLKAKFSALDLIAEEVRASDELIGAAVRGAGSAEKAGIMRFPRAVWMAAAAVLIAAGATFVVMNRTGGDKGAGEGQYASDDSGWRERALHGESSDRNAELGTNIAGGNASSGINGTVAVKAEPEAVVADRIGLKNEDGIMSYHYADGKLRAAGDLGKRLDPATGLYSGGGGFGGYALAEVDPFGEAPFAPASAIELVVLPRRDNVQLTIYNSADLTLVREKRSLTVKRGWNWLQFMWANTLIDPTSLSLEPLEHGDEVKVEQLVFPARLRELGRWLIRSEVSGRVPFEITYLTSGLTWRAFYMCTLSDDERSMRMDGYVRVDNRSGEDYEQAQTRLIVGKVHLLEDIAALAKRDHAYGRGEIVKGLRDWGDWSRSGRWDFDGDSLEGKDANGRWDMFYADVDEDAILMPQRKEIRKEGLSEYFLYTIEGTETIENQWGKRLSSFEAADVNVVSLYKYDEQRWSNRTMRFLSLTNDSDHNLGQTPLPNGNVRVYGAVGDSGLSYVGATQVKYIPVDEEVELNLGAARLVTVEPKLMDRRTENFIFDNNGNVSGWDELSTWRIDAANSKTIGVDIEITRDFGTVYWDMDFDDAGVSYEKHDATRGRFKLSLEPAGKRSLEYTVRTYNGQRQRSWRE